MLMERELPAEKPLVLLHPYERRFYTRLWEAYGDQPFTNNQARALTNLSKSGSYWKLRELMTKGFIAKVGQTGQSFLYKIIRSPFEY